MDHIAKAFQNGDWESFFDLLSTLAVPADFMADRNDETPQRRDLI